MTLSKLEKIIGSAITLTGCGISLYGIGEIPMIYKWTFNPGCTIVGASIATLGLAYLKYRVDKNQEKYYLK